MKESVRRNILSNGLANILSKTVRVAEQLLLVPFFLSAWGAAYYGEWLTLTIIPSVLAFAELGVGTSSCNAFVLSYSAGRLCHWPSYSNFLCNHRDCPEYNYNDYRFSDGMAFKIINKSR